jgi:hypothetical protein
MIKTRAFLEGKAGPEKSRAEKALVKKTATICAGAPLENRRTRWEWKTKLVKMVQ